MFTFVLPSGMSILKMNPCNSLIFTNELNMLTSILMFLLAFVYRQVFLNLVIYFVFILRYEKLKVFVLVILSKFNFYLILFSHWMLCGGRAILRSNHHSLFLKNKNRDQFIWYVQIKSCHLWRNLRLSGL